VLIDPLTAAVLDMRERQWTVALARRTLNRTVTTSTGYPDSIHCLIRTGHGAITCVAKTRTRTRESHWDRNKNPALQLEREGAVMNVDGNGNVFIFYLFI